MHVQLHSENVLKGSNIITTVLCSEQVLELRIKRQHNTMILVLAYSQAHKLSHELHLVEQVPTSFLQHPFCPCFGGFHLCVEIQQLMNNEVQGVKNLQKSEAEEELWQTEFVAICFTIQTTSYRTWISRRDFPFQFTLRPSLI